MNDESEQSLDDLTGPEVIRDFVKRLPGKPGVYRMFNAEGDAIYVGKARNLRNRVSNYARGQGHNNRIALMISLTTNMEFVTTATEAEALLLEANLIKKLKPRFNVILRDDKSFPYVHLSAHDFPRLAFYRGSRKLPGRLFGPYPSASAVHESLNQLHKLFRLRGCKDSFFANRSRPCLEYQIGRCSAPCTGLIGRDAYARDVEGLPDLVVNGGLTTLLLTEFMRLDLGLTPASITTRHTAALFCGRPMTLAVTRDGGSWRLKALDDRGTVAVAMEASA